MEMKMNNRMSDWVKKKGVTLNSKKSGFSLFSIGSLAFLIWTILILLDFNLCQWIFSLPANTSLPTSMNSSTTPCFVSPYCVLNVRFLLADPPDFYFFYPLTKMMKTWLQLDSQYLYITPNMISYMHIGVAAIAAKFVSQNDLLIRRIGCIIYGIRNLMDALDGVMAAVRRKHSIIEINPEYEAGRLMDGFCDAFGVIAFLAGCGCYLHMYPSTSMDLYSYTPFAISSSHPRWKQLKTNETKDSKAKWYLVPVQLIKSSRRSAGNLVIWFGFQVLLSSYAWNRYVDKYTEMMHLKDTSNPTDMKRKSDLLHSYGYLVIVLIWRYLGPHSLLHYITTVICLNRMGRFLYFVRYLGYAILFGAMAVTEMHLYYAMTF